MDVAFRIADNDAFLKEDLMSKRNLGVIAVLSIGFATLLAAQQPAAPTGETDHAAAIVQSLKNSMAALRQYQWVETTAVSLKGEE